PRLGDSGNRHLLDNGQVAALPIELQHVNLVALGVTDVHERSGARRRCHQRAQQDGRGEQLTHDVLPRDRPVLRYTGSMPTTALKRPNPVKSAVCTPSSTISASEK